jgi:CheY-like chemotaxis protein
VTTTGNQPEQTPKVRVLVVDDYPDSAEISSMLLTFYGHECRTAVTGQAALEQAAEFDPDIVILDIGLPDISGYDVARTLRARAGGRALYLAAVTGWGQPQDRVKALAAGFDQHVLKPIDASKILQILKLATERTVNRDLADLPAMHAVIDHRATEPTDHEASAATSETPGRA